MTSNIPSEKDKLIFWITATLICIIACILTLRFTAGTDLGFKIQNCITLIFGLSAFISFTTLITQICRIVIYGWGEEKNNE